LHRRVWEASVVRSEEGYPAEQLDQFLHRDWIRRFAHDAGFLEPSFTDGSDDRGHPAFWQTLAVLNKPGRV